MLFYIILYYYILYYSILYYYILCYSILYYFILYYYILCYSILCYFILYYSILYYYILYYYILCYSILYYIIIYYIILSQEQPHRIPSTSELFFPETSTEDGFTIINEAYVFSAISDRITAQCAYAVGQLLKLLPRSELSLFLPFRSSTSSYILYSHSTFTYSNLSSKQVIH